eukprot:GHVN01005382.1.p1 GENE.GHVN01005382.1~~GHVN01005382.1.p1  ORF type:complete len:358 (-),score=84.16 GHVN01005382.1:548-1621(-)
MVSLHKMLQFYSLGWAFTAVDSAFDGTEYFTQKRAKVNAVKSPHSPDSPQEDDLFADESFMLDLMEINDLYAALKHRSFPFWQPGIVTATSREETPTPITRIGDLVHKYSDLIHKIGDTIRGNRSAKRRNKERFRDADAWEEKMIEEEINVVERIEWKYTGGVIDAESINMFYPEMDRAFHDLDTKIKKEIEDQKDESNSTEEGLWVSFDNERETLFNEWERIQVDEPSDEDEKSGDSSVESVESVDTDDSFEPLSEATVDTDDSDLPFSKASRQRSFKPDPSDFPCYYTQEEERYSTHPSPYSQHLASSPSLSSQSDNGDHDTVQQAASGVSTHSQGEGSDKSPKRVRGELGASGK